MGTNGVVVGVDKSAGEILAVSDVSETGRKSFLCYLPKLESICEQKRGEESASTSRRPSSLALSQLRRLTSVDLKLARVCGSLQRGEMNQLSNGSRLVLPRGAEREEESARRA